MNPGTVAVGYLDPGEWSACFGMSLIDLFLVDAHGPRRIVPAGVQLRNLCPSGGIPDGRNEITRQFLATECEWLWMVDSDMGFGPTTVEDLIEAADPATRPVVGGLCFGLRREGKTGNYAEIFNMFPTVYDWYEDDDRVGFIPRVEYPVDDLVECSATGAACLLIHRTAVERVEAQYGPHWWDRITHPTGPTKFSEDLSFCVRLAAVGIPTYVDTRVKTCHHKGGIYLDETSWERQQLAAQAAVQLLEPVG